MTNHGDKTVTYRVLGGRVLNYRPFYTVNSSQRIIQVLSGTTANKKPFTTIQFEDELPSMTILTTNRLHIL